MWLAEYWNWFPWQLLWWYSVSLYFISILVQLVLTISIWVRCYHWECWRTEVRICDCGMCIKVSLGSIWLPEGTRSNLPWGLSVRTNACTLWPVGLFLEAEQQDLGEATGRVPVWLLRLAMHWPDLMPSAVFKEKMHDKYFVWFGGGDWLSRAFQNRVLGLRKR